MGMQFKNLWSLAAAAAIAAAACTGDNLNDNEEPAEPLTLEELCEAFIIHVNNLDGATPDTCKSTPILHTTTVDEDILVRLCRPGSPARQWAQDVLDSIDAERVSADWDKARECLEKSREIAKDTPAYQLDSNPDWVALRDGPCKEFHVGTVPDGQECVFSWDCDTTTSGCYTDDPFTPGSLRCQGLAAEAAPCDNTFHPCDEGLACDAGTCIVDMSTMPPVAIGEPCDFDFECDGYCVVCKAQAPMGETTCQPASGEGEFCEDAGDCVGGLGCTGNVCTTVPLGEACGGATESACSPDLICSSDCWEFDFQEMACDMIPQCQFDFFFGFCDPIARFPCGQFDFDQMSCDADPQCTYDAAAFECNPNSPTASPFDLKCNQMPSAGPCLHNQYCATGTFCDPNTTTCLPFAGDGQACDDMGMMAPPCDGLFTCVMGTCTTLCEIREDCPEGQYCDTVNEDPPACVDEKPNACLSNTECPDGQFCATCDFVGQSEQDCRNTLGCQWFPEGVCESRCAQWSDDEDTCNMQPGCGFDFWFGCTSVCTTFTLPADATACMNESSCNYDPMASGSCRQAVDCFDVDDMMMCGMTNGCYWSGTSCLPECWEFDGDEMACTGKAACRWSGNLCWSQCTDMTSQDQMACAGLSQWCAWEWTARCEPVTDCDSFDVQMDCTTSLECQWDDQSYCDVQGAGADFMCTAELGIGAECTDDANCVTNNCDEDDTGTFRCAVRDPNTQWPRDAEFLSSVILFGIVLYRRRRGR